jgi:hypothetical protein
MRLSKLCFVGWLNTIVLNNENTDPMKNSLSEYFMREFDLKFRYYGQLT